jgi:type IV secretory pathway VirB4 component
MDKASNKPAKNQEASQVFEKGMTSVLDFIAPPSMEIEPDGLKIGDRYVKILFTYAYPRYLWTNWLSPIINYDAEVDISMFIYPVESRVVVDNLRKKAGQIESSLRIEAEQGKVRDPKLEAVLQDIDALRDKLQLGTERFFQFCLYFAIYAPSKNELNHLVDKIEGILGSMLIYTKAATLQMEPGFNSVLPINNDGLFVTRNMDTSALSLSFPFTTTELTRDEGVLYGINKFNSTLVIFDRFKLENANMVVFAKAGAGKSYAVKLECLRSLMLGTEVIIIDPEEEYKSLCQAVNGTYIDVSLTSDKHMNPFDLPKVIEEEEEKDRLRSAIGNLHGLINIMLGKLNPEEDAIMDRALIETYNLKDINFSPETQNKIVPSLSDLEEVLLNMRGAESLNQRLRKYTQGTFAGLFNQPTNIDLDKELVVFSLRNLEEVLRPVAIYMIINYIWNRVRSELKKRILVIDEAWNLMQYEDSAQFIKGIAKRARKYYLGLTTITQDVEDFLVGQYGKAIITNSSLQLLLKQSPAAIDLVAGVFRLTEGEKYQLLQAEVGSGIFFAGATHVAIEIVASYMEDQLITTSPEQLLEIKKAKKALPETEEIEEEPKTEPKTKSDIKTEIK